MCKATRTIQAAGLAVALLLFTAPSSQAQTEYNLTAEDATLNHPTGAVFQQASTFLDDQIAAGTGVFKPFLRMQSNGSEEGHNTGNASLQNDEKGGPWTTNLTLAEIPVIGGNFLEFFLDLNETSTGRLLSLEELEIYASDTPNLAKSRANRAELGTKVYDLQSSGLNRIVLDYLSSGSGSGRSDLRALIPLDPVQTACAAISPCYIYVWSKQGATLNTAVLGTTDATSDDGFEEWNLFVRIVLGVSKTADPAFARTFTWEIDKLVDVDEHNLFNGQSGTSNYTVSVDQTVIDGSYAVSGIITITNPDESGTTYLLTAVDDEIEAVGAYPAIPADVDCIPSLPLSLAPGESTTCTYSADLPDDADRTNNVVITFSEGSDTFTNAAGAPISFGGLDPTTVVGYPTVNVDDSYAGPLGSASDDATFNYARTFTCGEDEGEHPNTAEIVETGQTADASVTVNCYGLIVTKECETSFTRYFDWEIVKGATNVEGPLTLDEGQFFTVFYQVDVTRDAGTDADFAVSCKITVQNEHPTADANDVALSDELADATGGTLSCGGTLDVAAGGSATCDYTADLPDATERTNTATATLFGEDYSGSAPVAFGDPSELVDACAYVSDADLGFGPVYVCENTTFDENDGLFYEIDTSQCDDVEHSFTNTSTVVEEDTGESDEDDETVTWTIPCPPDVCTLTQGYWKTHSMYHNDGKHYDPTWDLIDEDPADGLNEDTEFFLSGQSYIEVMWTAPKGNAYYILAHQYIAALLNSLNGATLPADVQTAFDEATALFKTYTPAQVAGAKGKNGKERRAQFTSLSVILTDFNEGERHCDDDGTNGTFDPEAIRAVSAAAVDADVSDVSAPASEEHVAETAVEAAEEAVAAVEEVPTEFSLEPNYPNPFNPSTSISFKLPESAHVTLVVYDVMGREVSRLVDRTMEAGTHSVAFEASDLASGLYIYQMHAGRFSQTRTMLLLK